MSKNHPLYKPFTILMYTGIGLMASGFIAFIIMIIGEATK